MCVQREHENYLMERKGIKLWSVLLVFIGTFLVMLFVTGMLQTWVATSGLSARAGILVGSAIQGIMAFMIPSLVAARMESNRPFVRAWSRGQAGIPLVRRCGYSVAAVDACDESDHILEFRDSFSRIPCSSSRALRSWEDRAAAMTDVILEGNSAMMLISGVLVVGVLTGFAEEAFFAVVFNASFAAMESTLTWQSGSRPLYYSARFISSSSDLSRGCCLEPPSDIFSYGPAVCGARLSRMRSTTVLW